MKLNVSSIRNNKGTSESFEIFETVKNVKSKQYDILFEGKVKVSGQVENADGVLYIEGRAVGVMTIQCDRCLEYFSRPFDVEISNVLYPANRPVDDIDFYKTFEGKLVDMDELVQEAVIISVPMTKVCSPDCRGICDGCGKNLNLEECICETDPYNPRMEALKDFFEEK